MKIAEYKPRVVQGETIERIAREERDRSMLRAFLAVLPESLAWATVAGLAIWFGN